jgi:hypothetical protein
MVVVVVLLLAIVTDTRHGLNLLCLGSIALQQHLSTLTLTMMPLSRAPPLVPLPMKASDEACADVGKIPSKALKTGPPITKLPNRKLVARSLPTPSPLDWDRSVALLKSVDFQAFSRANEVNRDPEDGCDEWLHPFSLAAQANASSADTPNCYQAMNGIHADGYKEAMQVEYGTLLSKHAWTEVKSEKWMNVVPSTWAFKCKRYLDGSVQTPKARFCVRGDKQVEGVDYFDTYAPVVTRTIVRIILILSSILGLAPTQVDYTAAFVHADVGEDVYIEMPKSFGKTGIVLKLRKSLYGLKQSPRNFFHHLRGKLHDVGPTSSTSDPCLFISDKVIALLYVDDTLFFSPKQEYIDEILLKLKAKGLYLNIKEDVAGFLGVHVGKNPNGSIELTQVGLTDRIIGALGIEQDKSTGNSTPAEYGCLGTNTDDEPCDETFNYQSVVGMM